MVEPRSFVKTKKVKETKYKKSACDVHTEEQLRGCDDEDGQEDEASSHRTISMKWNA